MVTGIAASRLCARGMATGKMMPMVPHEVPMLKLITMAVRKMTAGRTPGVMTPWATPTM